MQNENPSPSSNIITLILCIAIIAVGVFYFIRRNDAITITNTLTATSTTTIAPTEVIPATTTETVATSGLIIVSDHTQICGLQIESPKPNSKITFPLTVTGTIDNTKATEGCRWTMFEGQAGIAQLYVDNAGLGWDPVGQVFIVAAEDWMTTKTKFKTTIEFNNKGVGFKSGTKFRIRFTEEDPSGMNKTQVVDLPVELQ
ncbi:MAG: hypothetical protein RJB39_248 [Candidatus Parcubacteria bacterium]|jgi:hypothetical protein